MQEQREATKQQYVAKVGEPVKGPAKPTSERWVCFYCYDRRTGKQRHNTLRVTMARTKEMPERRVCQTCYEEGKR